MNFGQARPRVIKRPFKRKGFGLMNMRQLHILFHKPKLDIRSFVDFCVYLFLLHDVLMKLFWRSKQNNFIRASCKNWYKQVNTQKSTNNPMSSFGLIEGNIELSHIHLAVHSRSQQV